MIGDKFNCQSCEIKSQACSGVSHLVELVGVGPGVSHLVEVVVVGLQLRQSRAISCCPLSVAARPSARALRPLLLLLQLVVLLLLLLLVVLLLLLLLLLVVLLLLLPLLLLLVPQEK